jgi:hypothetical protein
MPSLTKHGIAVIQPTFDDESGRYVKTILIHGETGETLECRVPLIVQKNDMQAYGSAVTYARRYGLMGMAGIAPDDDDGQAAVTAAPRREEAFKFDTATAAKRITGKMAQAISLDDLRERWVSEKDTIARVKDMDANAYSSIERAKNDRKKSLEAAAAPVNSDLGDDSIPYEGPSA